MSGSYSVSIAGSLTASTLYRYRAAIDVLNPNTNEYEPIYGEEKAFLTTAVTPYTQHSNWLELPAVTGNENYVGSLFSTALDAVSGNDDDRNYSFNYSYEYFGSLWVAYPLRYSDINTSKASSSWNYFPSSYIPYQYQVNVTNNSYGTMYGNDSYSRGHMIPNADRNNTIANNQTYYVTNQTPQIQDKFNASLWSSLEGQVRNLLTSSSTVVYVTTGAVYQTVGGDESITYLNAASSSANPQRLPIPNYYWKALLKVTMNGSNVESASTIGFWFEHRDYDSKVEHYYDFATSVDFIEQMTDFDLFANLPDGIEATAEANTDWSTFQSF